MQNIETVHSVIGVACGVADFAVPVSVAVSLYLAERQKKQAGIDSTKKKSSLPVWLILGSVLLAAALNFLYFAVAVKKYSHSEQHMTELPAFTVTSENLHDEVWDPVISNTDAGENRSPQLLWEPVEGAAAYAIVMVDEDAQNWMHWKTPSVTTAGIPLGYAEPDAYIGPYPPAGQTHTYTIYVVALKAPKDGMAGMFDAPNDTADHDLKRSLSSLDTIDGKTGNAIAMGKLSGTFTAP